MAHTARAPHVICLLAVAGAFVPLFAGLVESGGRSPHPSPALPPLVEPPDAQREPELRPMPALAPEEEDTGRQASATSASSAPSAPPTASFARLTGIVLRPEGEPAVGARVVLDGQEAPCGPDGRFVLELAARTGTADFVAFEPGFEPAVRAYFGADLTRGSASEVRLVLGPATLTLAGQVLDRAGNPLAGWNVELDGLDPLATLGLREPVRTDEGGRFQLSDVPTGVHVVRATGKGGTSARSASVAAGSTGVVLVVEQTE